MLVVGRLSLRFRRIVGFIWPQWEAQGCTFRAEVTGRGGLRWEGANGSQQTANRAADI